VRPAKGGFPKRLEPRHEIQQLVINGWEDGRLLAQAMALRTEAKAKLTVGAEIRLPTSSAHVPA